MTHINKKELHGIYSLIHSRDKRKTLLLFNNDKHYTFSELQEIITNTTQRNKLTAKGILNHYLRTLVQCKVIKKDKRQYFLTRIGLQTVKLIKNFEKVCISYDLSDCNADGIITSIVKRNETK